MGIRSVFISSVIIFLSAMSVNAQVWPEGKRETKAGSRWWWLGSAVDKENLKWSMHEYAGHGIGALEITPLYGVKGNEKNNIDFLSPKWMEMLRYVEEVGKEEDIQIDMNFGTGWPFGGPTTPLEEAACRVSWVADTLEVTRGGREIVIDIGLTGEDKEYSSLQKVMAYPQGPSEWNCLDLTRLAYGDKVHWRAPRGTWLVIAQYCTRTREMVNRAAPGGEGWVIDHFDKDAVAHYIQKFEDAFASSGVPFPDTFFNDSYEVYEADWTPKIYEEFLKRRGYRLEEHLPELLIGGPGEGKILHDYRETLGDLIYEYFTCQWASWAHSHGVRVRNQAHGSPANLIDLYGAVDIPEIEGFGLSEFGIKGLRTDPGKIRKNFSDFSMLKYAPSAAHITGKKLTSSETFTWLTEHFRTSLSQFKPDMDLMFCAGVNRMLFHGTCYSPKDDPWPGWKFYASIDMSPTNTIWRDAPWFIEYVERCQKFLQWGEPDNDFLVYLPIHDMWSRRKDGLLMMFEISNMDKNAPEFIEEVLAIDAMGFGSDYISDKYLGTAKVRNGLIITEGGTPYKGLIIPEGATLPEATRKCIEDLKAAGAKVIDGLDKEAMLSAARSENLKTSAGLHWIRRKNPTGHHYFIANLTPSDVSEYLPLGIDFKSAMLFDPMTGKVYDADVRDGKVLIDLRSGESVILQTFTSSAVASGSLRFAPYPGKRSPEATPDSAHQLEAIDLTSNGWKLSFVEEAPVVGKEYSFSSLRTWEGLDEKTAVTMGTGVYSTILEMTREQAAARWAIDLGDVRESARVYVNGSFVGCAWAVPFVLECGDVFREGKNDIRIEVTNLPANRIAWMDRQGIPWRKFHNINVVDIKYKQTTYDGWDPVPSGLASKVVLLQVSEPADEP